MRGMKNIGMKNIGRNIAKARREAKLTQAGLARACGWGDDAQSRISNYERGRREPMLSELQTIADALGVTLVELIEGDYTSTNARIVRKLKDLPPQRREKVEDIVDAFLALPPEEKP